MTNRGIRCSWKYSHWLIVKKAAALGSIYDFGAQRAGLDERQLTLALVLKLFIL